LMQRHRLRGSQPALFCVAALAPFLVVIGIEQAAAPIVHRGHPSSLTGRHMFAKAALIDAPAWPEGTVDRSLAGEDLVRFELNRHLEQDYAPIRQLLASAPRDIRGVLSIYYETCLQGGCVDRSRALMPGVNEADQTKMLGEVAVSRIARAPGAFVDLWALNYASLWTVDRLHHPDRAGRLNAFIAAHRPMPFERLTFSLEPDQPFTFEPSPRVRYVQWAITALAVWTALLAAIGIAAVIKPARFPPSFAKAPEGKPLILFASVCALAAHGGLLLTALLAAGFSRFTIGVWPAIVTAAIVGAWATIRLKADGPLLGRDVGSTFS
jgi:hypothetical protein